MPRMLGETLIKDSTKRAFSDAMMAMRRALAGAERKSPYELESAAGKILEDAFVTSERYEAAMVRAQSEAALSGQQLSTLQNGIDGIAADNHVRIGDWDNNIKFRNIEGRQDFLYKTWDWLSQSVTWLKNGAK